MAAKSKLKQPITDVFNSKKKKRDLQEFLLRYKKPKDQSASANVTNSNSHQEAQ